eukprot:GFUD01134288.1.p1 GENE.GFUD01134288.1~~GFUD01134288.1.p1  ORF type:complete len:259 (+),score=65.24 GFUD01134288.1:92-778(+)
MGKCPQFTPMAGFKWEKFAANVWYVTHKTSTKSSCLTYTFQTDGKGFKSIRQARELPYTDTIGLNPEYISTGKLFSPEKWSRPAKMIAKFPLNMVGPSSFVILDSDYETCALLCTCQDVHVLSLFFAHRSSCSVLQRKPQEDPKITQKMKNVLLSDPALNDAEDDVSHLDAIDHADCKYGDRPLTIDVDKVVNSDLKTKNLLASSDEFELSITTLEDFKKEAADTLEF